jgi:IclR family acetate operon transcriptional repressor
LELDVGNRAVSGTSQSGGPARSAPIRELVSQTSTSPLTEPDQESPAGVAGGSQTLAKGLLLLELLAERQGADGVGLLELSRTLGWNKSTTHRLLMTLVAHGFAQQDPSSGRFRIGLKTFYVGTAFSRDLGLRNEAMPVLNALNAQTSHNTSLVVLEPRSSEVIFIEFVEGKHPLRMHTYVGMHFPVNCTAAGKAIMAYLPEAELESLLHRKLLARTTASIVSAAALRAQLPHVRANGFATDNQENAEGVRCVAAPIFDHRGYPVAAISVSGATVQIPLDDFPMLGPQVRRAADAISRSLGSQV